MYVYIYKYVCIDIYIDVDRYIDINIDIEDGHSPCSKFKQECI